MCDKEEDAARLVDFLLVVVRREAPRNLTESFVEWLETGCDGDVPAELVAAAKEALRRVGRVDVKETDDGAEARDALASAEKEIEVGESQTCCPALSRPVRLCTGYWAA